MTDAQRADEWRYGYLHGYLHGWADHKAGRQYGEGRYLRQTERQAVRACATCGSPDIFFDAADGWSCRTCDRTDADE